MFISCKQHNTGEKEKGVQIKRMAKEKERMEINSWVLVPNMKL